MQKSLIKYEIFILLFNLGPTSSLLNSLIFARHLSMKWTKNHSRDFRLQRAALRQAATSETMIITSHKPISYIQPSIIAANVHFHKIQTEIKMT